MATSYKTTKKSSRATSSKARAARPDTGSIIPYGDPIRDAIARGEIQEMRRVAAASRKWINDVQKGLDRLDQAVAKKGRK